MKEPPVGIVVRFTSPGRRTGNSTTVTLGSSTDSCNPRSPMARNNEDDVDASHQLASDP